LQNKMTSDSTDETPKYIQNMRAELSTALKQNLELRLRLDRL